MIKLHLVRRGRNALQAFINLAGVMPQRDYRSPSLVNLPAGIESWFPSLRYHRPFNPWVGHTGRFDGRYPGIGFATLDETTILFNYGLRMSSAPVIEVGCWVGWTTVAWALSGARLVVIDPVLDGLPQGESCRSSLQRAGVQNQVEFVPGYSHAGFQHLAVNGMRAGGIFIDGDHKGDAPLQDAMDAQEVANDDCVIILHDLLLPNIATALEWLGQQGWKTGVHYTAQFLGIAWRGNSSPLYCQPDPQVNWGRLVRKRYPHLLQFQTLDRSPLVS